MRRTAFAACSFLILIASGCASTRAPNVIRQKSTILTLAPSLAPSSTWALENLRPDEGTILIDGRTIPISIDMEASGDGHYALLLSADGKQFKPYVLRMVQGTGEIGFSGNITWSLKVKGQSETVTVALYRIEETELGKTEVRTLLKQFRRKYDVVCDEEECAIILFSKKLLRFCSCRSAL